MWSQWLLKRRFGGDPQRMKQMLDYLTTRLQRILPGA
jgi:hypothetical protein